MAEPHAALLSIARGEPVARILDEVEFLRSSFEHRMAGLVWSHMSTGALELTEKIAQEIENVELVNWGRHMRLWEGLGNVSRSLADMGVEFAVFKGVVSEERWFDRVGERPCWDVDILISPSARGGLDEIVARLDPDHRLAGSTQRLYEQGLIQGVSLLMGDIPVDVHFDLFKLGFPSSLDAEIWARSTWLETVTVPLTVRVLDPETSLLHALIHLGRDRFRRLLGYVDVAHMVERGEINWDEMESLARAEGIDSPAAVALSAVANIQHLKVGPIESHGWRLPLWKFLWRDETRLLGDVGNYKFRRRGAWLLPLTTRGRGLEAFRWIVKTILPPGALLDELHPGLSGPYLWRLIYGRSRFLVHRLRSLSGAKHPTQPTISSDPPSKGAPDVGDRSGDT